MGSIGDFYRVDPHLKNSVDLLLLVEKWQYVVKVLAVKQWIHFLEFHDP